MHGFHQGKQDSADSSAHRGLISVLSTPCFVMFMFGVPTGVEASCCLRPSIFHAFMLPDLSRGKKTNFLFARSDVFFLFGN